MAQRGRRLIARVSRRNLRAECRNNALSSGSRAHDVCPGFLLLFTNYGRSRQTPAAEVHFSYDSRLASPSAPVASRLYDGQRAEFISDG